MSQLYIASISRGLQSNRPALHASCTADIREPIVCAVEKSRLASLPVLTQITHNLRTNHSACRPASVQQNMQVHRQALHKAGL